MYSEFTLLSETSSIPVTFIREFPRGNKIRQNKEMNMILAV